MTTKKELIWHRVACVLHYHAPMVRWITTDSVIDSWWALGKSSDQVLPDRIIGKVVESFLYFSEIRSLVVYKDWKANDEIFTCNWPELAQQLGSIDGLQVSQRAEDCPIAALDYEVLTLALQQEP